MTKQKNRRIGLGMAPRGNDVKSSSPAVEMSRESAQEEVAKEVKMEVVLGEEGVPPLGLTGVQNLDSDAPLANGDTIVAQMKDYDNFPQVPYDGIDPLAAMLKESKSLDDDDNSETELMRDVVVSVSESLDRMSDIEAERAVEMAEAVVGGLGELPNGDYRATVRIAEVYAEGCRQQAEADGVSLEDWLSGHLGSYLEAWWGSAGAR